MGRLGSVLLGLENAADGGHVDRVLRGLERLLSGGELHRCPTAERTRYPSTFLPSPIQTLEAGVNDLPDYAWAYDRALEAIRADGYKLVAGSDGLEELYHVASDPGEPVDCSAEKPDQTAQLRNRLDEWLGSVTHAETDMTATIDDATEERLAELGYMRVPG